MQERALEPKQNLGCDEVRYASSAAAMLRMRAPAPASSLSREQAIEIISDAMVLHSKLRRAGRLGACIVLVVTTMAAFLFYGSRS